MNDAAGKSEAAAPREPEGLVVECPACHAVVPPTLVPPFSPQLICRECGLAWMRPLGTYVGLWARFMTLVMGVLGVMTGVVFGFYVPLATSWPVTLFFMLIAGFAVGVFGAFTGILLGYVTGYLLVLVIWLMETIRGAGDGQKE